MVFHYSGTRALVAFALLLSWANCQDAITKPDQFSFVTKGEDYSIVWSLIDPPEVSNVSIRLTNPNFELGSLGVITDPYPVGIKGREEDSGFFLYYYAWVPSELLETSGSYRIFVVDGNVTLESQSFHIGSVADMRAKEEASRGHGPSATLVGGVVGGAVAGFILIVLAILFYMARRKGWFIARRPEGEGPDEAMYHPPAVRIELEGSPGQYDYRNKRNSELPGSPVSTVEEKKPETMADLIQKQEEVALARKPCPYKP